MFFFMVFVDGVFGACGGGGVSVVGFDFGGVVACAFAEEYNFIGIVGVEDHFILLYSMELFLWLFWSVDIFIVLTVV